MTLPFFTMMWMAWKPIGGSLVMPPATRAMLRPPGPVAVRRCLGWRCISQSGLGVDAVVDGGAYAVIVGGVGKDFDLVVDRLDSLDTFDGVLSVALEVGREA